MKCAGCGGRGIEVDALGEGAQVYGFREYTCPLCGGSGKKPVAKKAEAESRAVAREDALALKRMVVLVNVLARHLDIEFFETPCERCCRSGFWQDGGECAACDGAGVIIEIHPKAKPDDGRHPMSDAL